MQVNFTSNWCHLTWTYPLRTALPAPKFIYKLSYNLPTTESSQSRDLFGMENPFVEHGNQQLANTGLSHLQPRMQMRRQMKNDHESWCIPKWKYWSLNTSKFHCMGKVRTFRFFKHFQLPKTTKASGLYHWGQVRLVPLVEQAVSTARALKQTKSNWFCASVLSRQKIRALALLSGSSYWIHAQLLWSAQPVSVFQEFQPGSGLGIVLNYSAVFST